MTTETEVSKAFELGASQSEVRHVEGRPFLVVPAGWTVTSLEQFQATPARRSGSMKLRDVSSFCAVIDDQSVGATRLYGNKQRPGFLAVFNDHDDPEGAPGWRDHTATYDCPLSVEWQTWLGANKKQMTQEVFAQFIEDNAPDCVDPDSATMIEISRTLEAKKKVNFASGIRLSDGKTEFTYEEDISGTASKGKLKVPETFSIGIAVLEGGPRYAVTARLRYRIGDKGALSLWYDLERPHKVLEDAVNEVWDVIEKKTGRPILNGGC